jgi:hypothetical protein
MPDVDVLFEVATPLGFRVRVTRARWELTTTIEHPVMVGRESSVRLALESPDEIRQSEATHRCFSSRRLRRADVGCAPLPGRPRIRASS